MKRAINKLAELADKFDFKLAQQAPVDLEKEQTQVRERLNKFKLEDAVGQVKNELMPFLGIKNPNDIKLDCSFKTNPSDKSQLIYCNASFSRAVAGQVAQRVESNRKQHPSFHLGNLIKQLIERFYPGAPAQVMVLPPF